MSKKVKFPNFGGNDSAEAYTLTYLFNYQKNLWRGIASSIFKWNGIESQNNDIISLSSQNIESILYDTGAGAFYIDKNGDLSFGQLIEEYIPDKNGNPLVWSIFHANGEQVSNMTPANSVLVKNRDDMRSSRFFIEPLAWKYAFTDKAIDINIMWQNINSILFVQNEKDLLSLKNIMKQVFSGYNAVYASGDIVNSFSEVANFNIPFITDKLADFQNIIIGRILQFYGLEYNPVDKNERTNLIEALSNTDLIAVSRLTMLEPRQIAAERINKLFGLNVSVDYNPAINKIVEELQKRAMPSNQFNGGENNG